MPGYARRATPDRIEVWVPSCSGTAHDMVDIPAGPFIDGGPGVPPTRFSEDIRREVETEVARFAIDRREVTRAAYRSFARMEAVTGIGFPEIPSEGGTNDDRLPIVGITALDAAAYCRSVGKDLPTAAEWRKVARGGVTLGAGSPNPAPKRAYPSGTDRSGATVGRIAPVGSSPTDVSPYGVLDMAGNVAEWTASRPPEPELARLRAVLGGGWNAPAELGHDHASYANAHDARYFDYATGVRCVVR
jgi:formylglycine-generating enzyme required for sulfatase activity